MVFNITEGLHGESRESHIPCFLEMLGIPYTGSGPLTLSVCLDKVRTKEVLLSYGIPTANYQVFETHKDKIKRGLKFPLIVKLAGEGSSMGLSEKIRRARRNAVAQTGQIPAGRIRQESFRGRVQMRQGIHGADNRQRPAENASDSRGDSQFGRDGADCEVQPGFAGG